MPKETKPAICIDWITNFTELFCKDKLVSITDVIPYDNLQKKSCRNELAKCAYECIESGIAVGETKERNCKDWWVKLTRHEDGAEASPRGLLPVEQYRVDDFNWRHKRRQGHPNHDTKMMCDINRRAGNVAHSEEHFWKGYRYIRR